MKRITDYCKRHPLFSQIILCVFVSLVLGVFWAIYNSVKEMLVYKQNVLGVIATFFASILLIVLVFSVFVYPIIVTLYEIVYLVCTAVGERQVLDGRPLLNRFFGFLTSVTEGINRKAAAVYDLFIIFLGVALEIILLSIHDVMFEAQWFQELRNSELHAPISKEGAVTFLILSLMFVAGVIVLTIIEPVKRAPLITVSSISLMYIGVIEAILFTIHILGMNIKGEDGIPHYEFSPDISYTILIPLNMLLILVRVMIIEIKSFEIDASHMSKISSVPFLGWCNRVLLDSKKWPVVALVTMIPLLICIIAVLVLFGQAPDDAIKAFTETANYTFSTKIPPQNVFYDEHYLCTVAAGGHKKIVKPVRMGKRHGHDVVVNRQLLIANAFEQILEEKTPNFHRAVRKFYDTYGFPVSKLIRSKFVADIIWFIMKPLEWVFLVVIYFVDKNPEDRIASQYL